MAVTRIVANLIAPDPIGLATFYAGVFKLDIPLEMGWIAFLGQDSKQKIELHTASQGGSGTELPVISIGVDDLDVQRLPFGPRELKSFTDPSWRNGGFGVSFSAILPATS